MNLTDEDGKKLDEEQLRAMVFTFMVAGHETSTVSLTWTLYYLSKYPEIQEKARQEVNKTLKSETAEWNTYESMSYLGAVINETLRLCPAGILQRQAVNEDIILGHKIPAGSVVDIPSYILHHRADYWEDPETFNPDRFLNKGIGTRLKRTFLRFAQKFINSGLIFSRGSSYLVYYMGLV